MTLKSQIGLFIFLLSLVLNIGYFEFKHFDFSHSPDAKSYLHMADGNYQVTVTHRYRFIVPFVAGAIAKAVNPIYERIWPNQKSTDMAGRFGFYVVNSLILALSLLYIFKLCQLYDNGLFTSLLSTIVVASNRGMVLWAGIPYTDSLYLLSIVLLFYGIRSKNLTCFGLAVFLGPLSKESYLLFLPIIGIAGYQLTGFMRTSVLMLVSALLMVATRYIIDGLAGAVQTESLDNAMNHTGFVLENLKMLCSVNGVGQVAGTYGLFALMLPFGLTGKGKPWKDRLNEIEWYWWAFLPTIGIHMLLSGDLSRMFYFTAPLFAIVFALIIRYRILPILPASKYEHA